MRFLPLVWIGLWHKRTRTIFTLLSILIAFVLFGVLHGINAFFSGIIDNSHLNRLYVMSRVNVVEPLPLAHLEKIEKIPGVQEATYLEYVFAHYQDPKNLILGYAIDPVPFFSVFSEFSISPSQIETMAQTRTGAIAGARLAEKYGWKIGDRIPLLIPYPRHDGEPVWSFTISGIYDTPHDPSQASLLLVDHAFFTEARGFGKGRATMLIANITDPAQSSAISALIDERFASSAAETRTQSEKEYAQTQFKQIGDINFMTNAIVGAVFFALLFLTGTTMMQSLRERIPEFAVLKTVGFTNEAVIALVLTESILLCVFAALCGLTLASVLFPYVKTVAAGLPEQIPTIVFPKGAAVAVLLAVISGLPPALRAGRLSIVDALAAR